MKLVGFLFILFITIGVFAQPVKKGSTQKTDDRKETAEKYVKKFLEFTSRTYEVFTDEFEDFLNRPNSFFPEDEEGRIMTEIQKLASDDVLRVNARARFKFAKAPGDTFSIESALQAIQDKFLLHFDSTANRVRILNKEQYAKAKSLPADQFANAALKNKSTFDALMKKLSDICDKMGNEYDEFMRCNMIREALSQSGKGQVNW